jgi:pimeloyl-ACP methyl ester carboxylesterase
MTDNFRLHGGAPCGVVALHGGPGAAGEARPFAEVLAEKHGVLEPFLLAETFEEQVHELKDIVRSRAEASVTLVGHSYGAMISYVFAARYPRLVRKLVMVSSGLLDGQDVEYASETRLSRLSAEDKQGLEAARTAYKTSVGERKKQAFIELFTRIKRADAYQLLPHESDLAADVIRPELYDSAWDGIQALRDSGELAAYGKDIKCPVSAIHGDYDPRPAESIRRVLRQNVKDFDFIVLKKCGHYPWYEKYARKVFYEKLLNDAL